MSSSAVSYRFSDLKKHLASGFKTGSRDGSGNVPQDSVIARAPLASAPFAVRAPGDGSAAKGYHLGYNWCWVAVSACCWAIVLVYMADWMSTALRLDGVVEVVRGHLKGHLDEVLIDGGDDAVGRVGRKLVIVAPVVV